MVFSCTRHQRSGAVLIEFALVAPLVFLLLFGLIVGGLGVFRFQEVAALARESARYASVRGGDYQNETGNASATADDIYQNAILPNAVILDRKYLSYDVSWRFADKAVNHILNDNYETVQTNTVTVTITYQWYPEWFLKGPITLTSTSTMPLSY